MVTYTSRSEEFGRPDPITSRYDEHDKVTEYYWHPKDGKYRATYPPLE